MALGGGFDGSNGFGVVGYSWISWGGFALQVISLGCCDRVVI